MTLSAESEKKITNNMPKIIPVEDEIIEEQPENLISESSTVSSKSEVVEQVTNEVNQQHDEVVDCINQSPEEVQYPFASDSQRDGFIAWDPITKLYELCTARKLKIPEFEYSVKVTSTKNASTHVHTVKCKVNMDSKTFWDQGVAGKKMTAKRIAAMGVYEAIAGRQIKIATIEKMERVWTCPKSKDEPKAEKTENDYWSLKSVESSNVPEIDIGGILLEEQKALMAWNPISRLYELCTARKWDVPEFEGHEVVVNVTAGVVSHMHMITCTVRGDDDTKFSVEGVAGTKKGAKRLASMSVLENITGCRRQDEIPALRPRS